MTHLTPTAVIFLLIAGANAIGNLSDIIDHARLKIETDLNGTRASLDQQIPILTDLISKSKACLVEENSTILLDIKNYTAKLNGYIADLRSKGNLDEFSSECFVDAEWQAFQSFNKILSNAGNCLLKVQTIVVGGILRNVTAVKDSTKRLLTTMNSKLNNCKGTDPYNGRRSNKPAELTQTNIACINRVFNEAYERCDELFYEHLALILQITNSNFSPAMKICTTKYSKDIQASYLFAKSKVDACTPEKPLIDLANADSEIPSNTFFPIPNNF